jgi:hypothetical protein
MHFDSDNTIIKLCAEGMLMEGRGEPAKAAKLFDQAWAQAESDFEKFTAAHYVARHQPGAAEKLAWDQVALSFALKVEGDAIKGAYPSLYLNIAKGYEDTGNVAEARKNYETAQSYASYLNADGYGNMIRTGILKGMERTLAFSGSWN